MASASVGLAAGVRGGSALLETVAGSGSGTHPYLSSDTLLRGRGASRNLADAVHCLCVLHGRQPGIVDHAANRVVDEPGRRWIEEAVAVFAGERALLTKLASAAGPMPSTPGNQVSEAALLTQRNAFAVLAQSDRGGCALGAALALAADWIAIRFVLDGAAERFGLPVTRYRFADAAALGELAEVVTTTVGQQRAMRFAAQQVAAQHHGLWDLLEARQTAREG